MEIIAPRGRVRSAQWRGRLKAAVWALALVVGPRWTVAQEPQPAPPPVQTDTTAQDLSRLTGASGAVLADPQARALIAILKSALKSEAPTGEGGARFGFLANGAQGEGGYDTAEGLLRLALERDERVLGSDHPGTATGLDKLARLLSDEGRPAEAEPLLRRALSIDEKAMPTRPNTARILAHLSSLLADTGRAGEAEPLVRRALSIDETALGADAAYVGDDMSVLAVVLQALGRPAEAEPAARRALDIDRKSIGAETTDVADDLSMLAAILGDLNRYREAADLQRQALAIDERALGVSHPGATAIVEGLATSELALGRLDRAVPLLRRACASLSAGLIVRGSHGSTYRHARGRSDDCAEGLAVALRAWAAADALARYGARSAAAAAGVGDQADAYEAALAERDRLDVEIANAVATQASPDERKALDDARDTVAAKLNAMSAALRGSAARYWAYRSPEPIDVAALRAAAGADAVLLRPDEALILLMVPPGDARGLVFAVTKENVAWARIGLTGDELRVRVERLRSLIDPSGYNELSVDPHRARPAPRTRWFDREVAHELYIALLGDPAIQSITVAKPTLLFVPSGPLTSLPPGLLVTAPPAGGTAGDNDPETLRRTPWLLREKAIAVLPSVSALRTLRQILPTAHAAGGTPLLALADPDFTPSANMAPATTKVGEILSRHVPPALAGTRAEAEAIRVVLDAPRDSVLTGHDASKSALMTWNADGRLNGVRVLEFATHAEFTGELPGLTEPALMLAADAKPEDELLLASEASTLRLNADWVLLSACDTASPDDPEAHGLSGLTRAFFFAGARSLLISHWHVRDNTSAILIPAMLRALRETPGLSGAEALRRASLAILDDSAIPDGADPASWAPFVLVGEAGS